MPEYPQSLLKNMKFGVTMLKGQHNLYVVTVFQYNSSHDILERPSDFKA